MGFFDNLGEIGWHFNPWAQEGYVGKSIMKPQGKTSLSSLSPLHLNNPYILFLSVSLSLTHTQKGMCRPNHTHKKLSLRERWKEQRQGHYFSNQKLDNSGQWSCKDHGAVLISEFTNCEYNGTTNSYHYTHHWLWHFLLSVSSRMMLWVSSGQAPLTLLASPLIDVIFLDSFTGLSLKCKAELF